MWLQQWWKEWERQYTLDRLARLNDHLLDDIGLRRDQLDALRLGEAEAPKTKQRVALRLVKPKPTLQGCG